MKKSVKILWRLFFVGIVAFVALILLANYGVLGEMPSIEQLENPTALLASQVYAEDGTLMGKYYKEDRVTVEYKDISPNIINALIATEDERFKDHNGVDPKALGRAFASFGRDGGASTLTMQTAKNLFTKNWGTRNIVKRAIQKLKESIVAVKLERNFTKEEILTLYLNTVSFSDNVFGIRNASKTFFQKEPDSVNVQEAAVLIGMLKGPTQYNPRNRYKAAFDRRNTVISQMVRNNYITEAEATRLKAQPIKLSYRKLDETTGLGPYFRMVLGMQMEKWCKEHHKQDGSEYNIYLDGLKIYTTINPLMQQYAEEAVSKHMPVMQGYLSSQANIRNGSVWKGRENILEAAMKQSDRWKNMDNAGIGDEEIKKSFYEKVPMKVFAWNADHSKDTVMTPTDSIKYHRQMLQAGFMAMDPLSGEIKAWVGGIDFKTFKFDHVNVNTKRQVGSTIKPLLYSCAIEDGGFTPTTAVEDVQQDFGSMGLVPATTTTCTGRTMPMWSALAQSRNCATAYIMKQLGPSGNDAAKHFTDYLKKCNITSNLPVVPSIALGSCEISLYEMMQAYSMFPGRGFNAKPFFITRIEDRNGNVLQTYMPQRVDVISDVTATYVVDMMQGVIEKGTGRRMRAYGVRGEVAGKTGTTNDNSDAWFMGYTPQLLCGVWTGCDDRFVRFSSTNLGQGSSVALPVWAYFYQKASADKRLGLDVNAKFSKAEGIMAGAIGQYKFEQAQDVNENEAAADGQGSSEEYGLPGSTPQTPQPNNNNNNGGYELRPNEQRPPANTPKKQR